MWGVLLVLAVVGYLYYTTWDGKSPPKNSSKKKKKKKKKSNETYVAQSNNANGAFMSSTLPPAEGSPSSEIEKESEVGDPISEKEAEDRESHFEDPIESNHDTSDDERKLPFDPVKSLTAMGAVPAHTVPSLSSTDVEEDGWTVINRPVPKPKSTSAIDEHDDWTNVWEIPQTRVKKINTTGLSKAHVEAAAAAKSHLQNQKKNEKRRAKRDAVRELQRAALTARSV